MYQQMPQPIQVEPTVSAGNISFMLNHQITEVPASQQDFLGRLGWQSAGKHPDTSEDLFRKPCPSGATNEMRKDWPYELGSGYWHWYEAVAYEFSKFITIGDDMS